MTRAPFNVLVYPYRLRSNGRAQFAIFRRSDDVGFWQGIAGCGEGAESPLQSAIRESFEEAGISRSASVIQLDTVMPVPVTAFNVVDIWPPNLYVIPQYAFGVQTLDEMLRLSKEHTESCWLSYTEARDRIRYEGSKIALWELNQRVLGLGPRQGYPVAQPT